MGTVGTLRKYLVFFSLMTASCITVKQAPICCFPDRFEAFMFISQGTVDVLSGRFGYGYGYSNGTVRTAYDGINQLTFTHEHTYSLTSIWPIPLIMDYINILDYKNNVQWRVYADGSCDRMEVGLPLYPECIPGNASLLSEGTLGQTGIVMKTYIFHDHIYGYPYEVTITVTMSEEKEGECIPVRMTTSEAYVFDSNKNVDITVADIYDFSPGIQHPAIFSPPSACDNASTVTEKDTSGRSGRPLDKIRKFVNRKEQRRR